MMTAYGYLWLGQDLPAFTTVDGAITPFGMESKIQPPLLNETWTAATDMYRTTLSCEPAIAIRSDSGVMKQGYDNGKGCVIAPGSIGFETSSPFAGLYIGYYMDQQSDYALSSSPGCAALNNSHTFLAIWAANLGSHTPNITALFCESAYWIQSINATVTVPNMTVSNIVPLASPIPLASEDFNVSNYEYVIGTGASTSSQRSDIASTTSIINQAPRLERMGLNPSVTNMVGFAVGASRLELARYLDTEQLAKSFEKAHKLLFALAVRDLFTPGLRGADPRVGIVQGDTNAVMVFRILGVIVEILLGLIAVFALVLLSYSWTRPSQLEKDPASLTDLVDMLPAESGGAPSSNISSGKNMVDDKCIGKNAGLSARIKNGKMIFTASADELKQAGLQQNTPLVRQEACDVDHGLIDKESRLFRPVEMASKVAGIFILILLLALTSLVVLKLQIQKHLGLPLPSRKPVVTNIVLNYIPVVFATFLEPFWVLLNRLLCVLRPFEELRNGQATASQSLDLRYMSLPPQLVIFRALNARHFLLAAVCAISVSANILAVSLSGLFQTDVVSIESNVTFTAQYLPIFNQSNGTTGSDHIYIAKSNFSDGTALPPWVSRDTFFIPFGLDMKSTLGDVHAYKATTQGFRIKVECLQTELDSVAYITNAVDRFIVPRPAPGGRNIDCSGINNAMGGQNNSNAALEVLQAVTSNVSKEHRDLCETILVAGFLRANLSVSHNLSKTGNDANSFFSTDVLHVNTVSSLWLICQPTFVTAPYQITVDSNGRVQTYTLQAPYSTDLSPYFTENFNLTSLIRGTSQLLATAPDTNPFWHNDTFVDSWFAYFVKTLSNSTLPTDPSAPIPAFDAIAPLVEDIYTRLFAIILGLHPDWFSPAPPGAEIPGTVLVSCTRVFMSHSMLIIAMALISLNVLVAVAYYIKRPKRMLAQMPNTIASMVELFEGSGLIAEKNSEHGWRGDWRFGYGRFVGTDRKPHLGIERRPFVVPWADG